MIAVETFSSVDLASGAMGADTAYLGGGTLVMRALNYGEQNFTRIVRSTDPVAETGFCCRRPHRPLVRV